MSLEMGKHLRREEDGLTGMEIVAGNEDLLTLILLRLPVRSLLRFKSVSKHWLSLISDPQFCALKTKLCCKHVSGLLLNPYSKLGTLKFEFVPFDHDCPAPFQRLDFLDGELKPLQYCNGLLLCWIRETKYYIFNPTTKQHTTVSFPVSDGPKLYYEGLAFDPRKSPHFKLICLFRDHWASGFCVRIYSSQTGLMTQFSDLFPTSAFFILESRDVYWNGAINWMTDNTTWMTGNPHECLYFNVEEERFGLLPKPPHNVHSREMPIKYFGESNDHLYLVLNRTSSPTQLDVYEMDREYSGWFVRFRIDLQPMFRAFPTEDKHYKNDDFSVMTIVDEDFDQNSFIVFGRPGKAIRFHLKDKVFTKICDFAGLDVQGCLPLYCWNHSFQFIESLHPLPLQSAGAGAVSG